MLCFSRVVLCPLRDFCLLGESQLQQIHATQPAPVLLINILPYAPELDWGGIVTLCGCRWSGWVTRSCEPLRTTGTTPSSSSTSSSATTLPNWLGSRSPRWVGEVFVQFVCLCVRLFDGAFFLIVFFIFTFLLIPGVSLLRDFADFREKWSLVSGKLTFVQRKRHVGTSKFLSKSVLLAPDWTELISRFKYFRGEGWGGIPPDPPSRVPLIFREKPLLASNPCNPFREIQAALLSCRSSATQSYKCMMGLFVFP